MKKRLVNILLADAVIFSVLASLFSLGYFKAQEQPVPIYGDYQEIVGRHFSSDYSTPKKFNNCTIYYLTTVSEFESYSDNFLRKIYPNYKFVRSELKLLVNSSNVIKISLADHHILYYKNTTKKWFDTYWSIKTNYFEGSYRWAKKMLGVYEYRSGKPKYGIYPYFIIPSISWNSSESDVWFEYEEIWEYTPVTGYDYSSIEQGKTLMGYSLLLFLSTIISNFLLYIYIESKNKENEIKRKENEK